MRRDMPPMESKRRRNRFCVVGHNGLQKRNIYVAKLANKQTNLCLSQVFLGNRWPFMAGKRKKAHNRQFSYKINSVARIFACKMDTNTTYQIYEVDLLRSPKLDKKWRVIIHPRNEACMKSDALGSKVVDFGSAFLKDYTEHKDTGKRQEYLQRYGNTFLSEYTRIDSEAFWCRFLLWEKPTLPAAIRNLERQFPVRIQHGCIHRSCPF
jgi:hypothetical protein